MIKANELRIGNLVSVENKPYIITSGDIYNLDCYYKRYIKFYEPIPLTEKLFENFEAKRDDLEIDSYVLSSLTCDYRFFKSTLIDGDIYWTCEKVLGDTSIEYVHQLQNLYFALTGEELKLNDK